MRMSKEGPTAADIVNTAEERALESMLRVFGEERQARRIAHAIVEARGQKRITRTLELANLVASVARTKPGERIHPATRTFQALRIALNDELKELALGLSAAERLLKEAGRLAVVSFHSLEDRIVKLFLAERSKPQAAPSRHRPPAPGERREPTFRVLTKRPVTPSEAEVADNPRARSAKLRAAERLSAPALPLDLARLGVVEKAP
jgi:16S rRNA (cytosine1402-N4)-methyltransferase